MKFRKKPVVIDAVKWGGIISDEICAFLPMYKWRHVPTNNTLLIDTLEGTMVASVGDWIIRGVKGEFYPCKPDIFKATYEPTAREGGSKGGGR